MDIKNRRRNGAQTGKTWDITNPEPEGMYPGNGTNGNCASDNNVGWDIRAQSWQRGADTDYKAIDDEKREEDLKYGVPYADVLPNPAAGNKPDGPLPNPHNFSSNPGFMGTSTGDMASMGSPANGGTARIATNGSGRSLHGRLPGGTGTVGRTAVASPGNASLPAPGDIDPASEGEPLQVTSGYNG